LNELQCALLDRKRAMKKRERIALKRFYKKQAVVCGGETNGKNPHLADGNADEDEIDSDWYSRNLDSSETDDDSSIAKEVCDDRVDSDEEDKQQFDDGENSSSSDRQM
uniref:Transposase, MuDR, MULE transposase domain protein n=1 Tax=Anisakis simplex TaxID=6269 RepID=A0A0M3JMW0_ANISI